MNIKELETVIIEMLEADGTYKNPSFYDGDLIEELSYIKNPINGYAIKNIDAFGGEGEGDSIWNVFALYKDNKLLTFFKTEGYYDSWNGVEWDEGFNIVTPREKIVIEWY